MPNEMTPAEIQNYIRGQLVTLVELCKARHINIAELFRQALEIADYDPYG